MAQPRISKKAARPIASSRRRTALLCIGDLQVLGDLRWHRPASYNHEHLCLLRPFDQARLMRGPAHGFWTSCACAIALAAMIAATTREPSPSSQIAPRGAWLR